MAGDVTLTAAMRANLYSLQQTAQMMGTIQSRLATGKKVNSALDNPNNYFTAQSLSNRASDIGGLLDGMGQAIQTIKAATQGIESAQKLIDQMKAVANSALSSATSSASARTPMQANGDVDANKQISKEDAVLLTNLKNESTGANVGYAVGETVIISVQGGASSTFTATETSTVEDLVDFIESTQANVTASFTNGVMSIKNSGAATLTLGGTGIDELGLTAATIATGGDTALSSITLAAGPNQLADLASGGTADDTILLTSLVDEDGKSMGIAMGDTLTVKLGDSGNTVTFTVGADASNNSSAINKNGGGVTLKDLETWLEAQGAGGGNSLELLVSGGKIKIDNDDSLALTVGGSMAETLGLDGTAAATTGYVESSSKVYNSLQSSIPVVTSSTLLRDITSANGTLISGAHGQVGDSLTVTTTAGATKIEFTAGMTVKDLMTRINAIDDKLNVTLDSNGRFVVDNQMSGAVTFSGSASGFFVDPLDGNQGFAANAAGSPSTSTRVMYAGFAADNTASGGSSAIDSTKASQFDTLRTQLDELVRDASYQGVNLISGSSNSPLTVTFNEAATNASKLVISAVDLTTSGLSIKAASGEELGSWRDADAVRDALSNLTEAATTLRNQAATLGYNLSTVQNRQDFAQNMIATLKEGADKLTLADMNEEGANMLALQTRSQLGTQSLSLASQANQSVMRLFG